MRRLLATVAALSVTGALLAAAPAGAATPRICKAADLRYPFMPGGPNAFGILRLTIVRGTCTTARRVARRWQLLYEERIAAGADKPPTSVYGFRFTKLQTRRAQETRHRGRKGTTSIRFDYRVPNG